MKMGQQQLSFEVEQHPALPENAYLTASLKVAGSFHVTRDLQPGAELYVTISDADGVVVTQGQAQVGPVAFLPVKDRGEVIGTERAHKAALQ